MSPSRDRASTLLFFPAALLVMMVLAAITVDLARVQLAQRQAEDAAAAAASDAATLGLDQARLRATGEYRLSPDRVSGVVADAVTAHDLSALTGLDVYSRVTGARGIIVDIDARAPLAFARSVPGSPGSIRIHARARAKAVLR